MSSSSSSSSRLIVDQRPGRADGGSDHHRVHARSSVVVVPSSSIRVMSSCGRARRSESIIALRKSRRGQAVSRKRHMTMASMTTSVAGACDDYVDAMTSTTTNAMVGDYGDGDMDGMNNPYHADTRRCRDAMHSASLIVDSVHSIDAEEDGIIKDDHVRNMKAHLERLCALITPVSDDDAISATVASNSILRARTTSGNNLGWDLADALRRIIIEGGDGKMFQRDETLRAVMVVNQLAASEPPPPTEGGGRTTTARGWRCSTRCIIARSTRRHCSSRLRRPGVTRYRDCAGWTHSLVCYLRRNMIYRRTTKYIVITRSCPIKSRAPSVTWRVIPSPIAKCY
jgi:hypothetical protein